MNRTLNERDKLVLCMRFGIGFPELTLKEVAMIIERSQSRVRQIEACALRKIRWMSHGKLDNRIHLAVNSLRE